MTQLHRPFEGVRVIHVMNEDVATGRTTDSLQKAAGIMTGRRCGFLPIVDASGRCIGVLTDRDALLCASRLSRGLADISVAAAYRHPPITCGPQDTVERAEELMRANHVRRLVVVDETRHPVGVLSLSDLARHMEFETERSLGGLSPTRVGLVLAATSTQAEPPTAEPDRPPPRSEDETFPAFLPPDPDVFSNARRALDDLTS